MRTLIITIIVNFSIIMYAKAAIFSVSSVTSLNHLCNCKTDSKVFY